MKCVVTVKYKIDFNSYKMGYVPQDFFKHSKTIRLI